MIALQDRELNKLERYQLEILANYYGYEPTQDDSDADLILIAHIKMHEAQNQTSEGKEGE